MSAIDWEVVRGDTDELPYAVTILGSTDITGASVRMAIRDTRPADGTLAAPMSTVTLRNLDAGGSDAEILITDGLAGELSVYLGATTFSGLTGQPHEVVKLLYDLEVLRVDGERRTVATGALYVRIDVTE